MRPAPPRVALTRDRASIERRKSFDGVPEGGPIQYISTNDLHIKDAFLVFRALCKLSMKPLGADRCVVRCVRLR